MSHMATSDAGVDYITEQILLVPAEDRSAALNELVGSGLLQVDVPAPGPALRGRLALLLENAIEEALQGRGSVPPGVEASTDLDASLADQLYRARQLGASGVALWVPSLMKIANLAGALDAEDSAVLRWWLATTVDRPVRLLIDDRNRRLGVYQVSAELGELIERGAYTPPRLDRRAQPHLPLAALDTRPHRQAEARHDVRRMQQLRLDLAPSPTADADLDLGHGDQDSETPDPGFGMDRQSESVSASVLCASDPRAPTDWSPPTPASPTTALELALVTEVATEPTVDPPQGDADDRVLTNGEDLPVDLPVPADRPRREPKPLHSTASREWRAWMRDLDGSRGPKSLAAVERAFVTRYVPLSDAVACGIADASARPVLHRWADSFSRSYLDAFHALRLRGTRPAMVLDVPDLALRIGRLHGARSVQLLVVDGMRFDLGLRVHEQLRLRVEQHAMLTERLLLWAALPSTTDVQLDLLRRGPEGLRDLRPNPTATVPLARGHHAATLRRLKSGQRELLKLDVIESRLSEPGERLIDRFDAVASQAADVIAEYMLSLAVPTLVVVFGDHGFVIEESADGTGAARHGGASPEEVLVPAFAWVVGSIH